MFDYVRGYFPDRFNRFFTFSYVLHSYQTRSSEALHIPKRNTSRFDCAKLWNKFYFELSNKEMNFQNSKLKTLLKTNFLTLI